MFEIAPVVVGASVGKVCKFCGEWKPADEFYATATNTSGLSSRCKVCLKEYHKQWRSGKRLPRKDITFDEWFNPDTFDPDAVVDEERARKWLEYSQNRRARKHESTGEITPEDIAAIRKAQTDKKGRLICWRCHKPITDTPDLDHFIPLKLGGTHSAGNLHFMHAKCNRSKNAKHPHDLGMLI